MRPLRAPARAALHGAAVYALVWVPVVTACASDAEAPNGAPGPDGGLTTDAGDSGPPMGDSGSMVPAHERLDCELPAVIEYCGGATCHYDNAAPDVASSLVLWNRQAGRMVEDVAVRLVGVPATYRNVPDPERCPTEPQLLVDPSDIEQSLLLRKLEATHACGVEMPKFPYPEWGTVANPGPQRAELVSCVRDWVALLVEDYARTR